MYSDYKDDYLFNFSHALLLTSEREKNVYKIITIMKHPNSCHENMTIRYIYFAFLILNKINPGYCHCLCSGFFSKLHEA